MIQLLVSLVVLGFLYYRMVKREIPSPVDKGQAIIPVAVGILSLPLSFVFVLGIGLLLKAIGYDSSVQTPIVHSFTAAAFAAGIPEELAKLLIMLLSLRLFRKKIRNVYEYILIGAATGLAFTLFEEFLYGSDIITTIGRLITVAAHMVFGIIMAKHLGMARVRKEGSVFGEYAKALLIPVVIHTLYDAFTAFNFMMQNGDDVGVLLGIAAIAAMFVGQIIVLIRLKKNTEKYCGMKISGV